MLKCLPILFLLAALSSCKNRTYVGYWYETGYEIDLNSDNSFRFSYSGHRGNTTRTGSYEQIRDTVILFNDLLDRGEKRYLLMGDTCIIDLDSHWTYCNHWDDTYGSYRAPIRYPQVSPVSLMQKEEVDCMFQQVLTNPVIAKYMDTLAPLIIQTYHHFDEEYSEEFRWQDMPVYFLTEQQIRADNIDDYLMIDVVVIGEVTASFQLRFRPENYRSVFDFFDKENGAWQLNKRSKLSYY